MNVNDALRQARALLAIHGLTDWKIKLDNGKNRMGQCNYSAKTISLSRYGIEMRSVEDTLNTVLHEIAHALTPRHGHDAVWARKCREIGGNGQQFHTDVVVPYRYVSTCPNGHTGGRHKLTKAIKVGASCGRCSPKFDVRYRLVWVDTQGSRV